MTLQLPIAYAALEAGDLLQLNDGAMTHRIRVQKVQIGRPGLIRVSGVIDAAEVSDRYVPPVIGSDGSSVLPSPVTRFEVLDIPALPSDAQDALTLRFAACVLTQGWNGAAISQVIDGGDDPVLLTLSLPAVIGTAVSVLPVGEVHMFDRVSMVDVSILGNGSLSSVTESNILNSANAAVIGDEVIQFQTATLLSPGVYRLSNLLRGRLGTEAAMASHVLNERFVLLNEAVVPLTMPVSIVGQTQIFQATTFGEMLGNGTLETCTIQANSLKPLSPVRLSATLVSGGDIRIDWVRRTRIDGGLRDYVDVPLREESEQYEVSIYDGVTLKRSWRVAVPTVLYTAAEQIADFSSAPSSVAVRVAQLSALVGLGNAAQETLAVV